MALRVEFLREVLRHLPEFRDAIAEGGSDVVTDESTGDSLCYYDVFLGWTLLTDKQRKAVFFWVMQDMTETDAARAMGYNDDKGTSQVRDYAMVGLTKMAELHEGSG